MVVGLLVPFFPFLVVEHVLQWQLMVCDGLCTFSMNEICYPSFIKWLTSKSEYNVINFSTLVLMKIERW